MRRIQTQGVKIVYVLLLHPLHMLKSCDRTISALLNVLNREGMCWFPRAWQTVLCAEVYRVIFSSSDVATSRNPFSHPTKVFKSLKTFPVHTSLQTNYFYMITRKQVGTHSSHLRKDNSCRIMMLLCDLKDKDPVP